MSTLSQPSPHLTWAEDTGPQSDLSQTSHSARVQSGRKSKVLNSAQCSKFNVLANFSPSLRLTTSSRPSQANAIREVDMIGPRYKSIFLPAVPNLTTRPSSRTSDINRPHFAQHWPAHSPALAQHQQAINLILPASGHYGATGSTPD